MPIFMGNYTPYTFEMLLFTYKQQTLPKHGCKRKRSYTEFVY